MNEPRLFLKTETQDTFTRTDITDRNLMIKKNSCDKYKSISVRELLGNMQLPEATEDECSRCDAVSCEKRRIEYRQRVIPAIEYHNEQISNRLAVLRSSFCPGR